MRFNFLLCKDSAKRVQDKMKSRRIYIFHAELQPIFAKGCTNSLHPSIIHHYILINFHHPPIAHISSPIGARQMFLTKEASFAERRERFFAQAKCLTWEKEWFCMQAKWLTWEKERFCTQAQRLLWKRKGFASMAKPLNGQNETPCQHGKTTKWAKGGALSAWQNH